MKFFCVHSGSNYPPDKHLLDGLEETDNMVTELLEHTWGRGNYLGFISKILKNENDFDAIIIGYGLPLLVPIMRLCKPRTKIIFNAVSSQYEANIVSRSWANAGSPAAYKWWLVDFISFHAASIVLLESNSQIDFVHKLFHASRKKLVRSWTGVDEKEFYYDTAVKKHKQFTVLFRGRFLPESGVLTVIEAAKRLEQSGIQFHIIGNGFMYREVAALMGKLEPQNIMMTPATLPVNELRKKMLACHLSLGQLADHPRLLRTLPCKLFESIALRLPYLTARNPGALELLVENETCFAVKPGDSTDLAEKILLIKNNPDLLEKVARQGFQLYKTKLTSKQLALDVLSNCFPR